MIIQMKNVVRINQIINKLEKIGNIFEFIDYFQLNDFWCLRLYTVIILLNYETKSKQFRRQKPALIFSFFFFRVVFHY